MNAIEHNPLCNCADCQFDLRCLIAANSDTYDEERPKVVRFKSELTKVYCDYE